jgi:hypothetical protein
MPPSYQTFFSTDFASGFDSCLTSQNPAALSIIDAPGGGGGKVMKVRATRGAGAAGVDFSNCSALKGGRDYMITWTTYVPPDYLVDKNNPETVFEIRQGHGSGPAPFSLSIRGDQYEADLHNGAAARHYDIGPVGGMGPQSGDKGYWVRWTLHYRPDAIGRNSATDLYKNDVLVMSANGVPNAYPGDDAAYIRTGVDKSWSGSELSQRSVYFGDIAIGAKP